MPNFISRIFSRKPGTAVAANDSVPTVTPSDPRGRPGVFAFDGIENLITGMGTSADKSYHTTYQPEVGVDRVTCDAIFRSSWLARRVVTSIADDMCRKWRTVMWDGSSDDDGIFDIQREEQRVALPKNVHSAIKWARHYGGAIVVMIVKGQDNLEEPLNVDRVKKGDLLSLVVYDRWRLYGAPPDKFMGNNPHLLVPYLNQQLGDPNFGLPEFYYLADTSMRIHHTRCVRFDGEELPWTDWMRNAMWHDSVYKSLLVAIKNYDSLIAACGALAQEASVDVLSADQLADNLADDKGRESISARYQLLSMMKSVHHMIVIDKEREAYDRKPVTFGGLRDLLDRFAQDVAGAADVPLTRLFGMAPGGLNSTGEGDQKNYDDHISAKQVSMVSPQLYKLDQVMVRSALGYMPDDYRSTWNPLRQMSDAEKAEIDSKRATRDKTYLESGVLTEGAVARELRASGTYPNMTQDDVDLAEGLSAPVDTDEMEAATAVGKPAEAIKPAGGSMGLTPTMQGSIMTVNEARAKMGLGAWPNEDGNLTIVEFQAKHGEVVAEAVNAEAGTPEGSEPKMVAAPFGGKPEAPEEDDDEEEKEDGEEATAADAEIVRDECGGRFGESGGKIGSTRSGKHIMAPARDDNFAANEAFRQHPEKDFIPISALKHAEEVGKEYSQRDHMDAHKILMEAARKQFDLGNVQRAHHLATVAQAHKYTARELAKKMRDKPAA
jgi:hypothetical protein